MKTSTKFISIDSIVADSVLRTDAGALRPHGRGQKLIANSAKTLAIAMITLLVALADPVAAEEPALEIVMGIEFPSVEPPVDGKPVLDPDGFLVGWVTKDPSGWKEFFIGNLNDPEDPEKVEVEVEDNFSPIDFSSPSNVAPAGGKPVLNPEGVLIGWVTIDLLGDTWFTPRVPFGAMTSVGGAVTVDETGSVLWRESFIGRVDAPKKEKSEQELQADLQQIEKILEDPECGFQAVTLAEDRLKIKAELYKRKDPTPLQGAVAANGIEGLDENQALLLGEVLPSHTCQLIEQAIVGDRLKPTTMKGDVHVRLDCLSWAHQKQLDLRARDVDLACPSKIWTVINPSPRFFKRMEKFPGHKGVGDGINIVNDPTNVWVVRVKCDNATCSTTEAIDFYGCPVSSD